MTVSFSNTSMVVCDGGMCFGSPCKVPHCAKECKTITTSLEFFYVNAIEKGDRMGAVLLVLTDFPELYNLLTQT